MLTGEELAAVLGEPPALGLLLLLAALLQAASIRLAATAAAARYLR